MRVTALFGVPGPVAVLPDVRVSVRVLDVSRADAASVLLGQRTVPLREHLGPPPVPPDDPWQARVDLRVPALDPGRSYALAVHVDVDGTGGLTRGDLFSTTHVEVGPQDDGQVLEVPLREV